MDAANVLQIITLGVSGWTLLEVIRIGRAVERHDQKLTDLPCDDCESKNSYGGDI
jgi:hypothetical protein